MGAERPGLEELQSHSFVCLIPNLRSFVVSSSFSPILSVYRISYLRAYRINGLTTQTACSSKVGARCHACCTSLIAGRYTAYDTNTRGVQTNTVVKGARGSFTHHVVFIMPLTSCLAVWIRGLHEAWSRLDSKSSAAVFIESYLYVQVRRFALE